MPVIKELQDIVDLLGKHDEAHQRWAINSLTRVLDAAEQDIADGDLSATERRVVWQQRMEQRAQVRHEKIMALVERLSGKAAAEELHAAHEKSIEEVRQRRPDLDSE